MSYLHLHANPGNSQALVIEKGVLELLGISKKTPLRVSTDGSSLIISPVKQSQAGIRDMALLESAMAPPSASFGRHDLHRDLHEMAAAYAFHLRQCAPPQRRF